MSAASRRLLLLRHGQTSWNAARRIQGQADSPLDETGHAQARAVAPAIAAMAPARIWCSDLSRAADTAAYLASACGLTVRADARLREYALGLREGLDHEEYAAAYPEESARFRAGDFDAVPEGEPTPEVAARMAAVLDDLLAQTDDGELSVAVSHGAAIRVAVGALLGWPPETHHSLRGLDNCAWVLLAEHPEGRGLRLGGYNRSV